nr:unnamed protein product [Callosobruchus chinensis]
MAEPQPKVLNIASLITPLSLTFICNFLTSPHDGAPTKPVPTFGSFLSESKHSLDFRIDLKFSHYNS